jgi:hypothetical protein
MLELDREIKFDSARAEEFFQSLPSYSAVVRIMRSLPERGRCFCAPPI